MAHVDPSLRHMRDVISHRSIVGDVQWHIAGVWLCLCAWAAWCAVQLLAQLGLRELPYQGVLPAAAPHN